jgi:hypothetical protein
MEAKAVVWRSPPLFESFSACCLERSHYFSLLWTIHPSNHNQYLFAYAYRPVLLPTGAIAFPLSSWYFQLISVRLCSFSCMSEGRSAVPPCLQLLVTACVHVTM